MRCTSMRGPFLQRRRQVTRRDGAVTIYFEDSFYLSTKSEILLVCRHQRKTVLCNYTPKEWKRPVEPFRALHPCRGCPLVPDFCCMCGEKRTQRNVFSIQTVADPKSVGCGCAEKYDSFQNKFLHVFGFGSNNNAGSDKIVSLAALFFLFSLLPRIFL